MAIYVRLAPIIYIRQAKGQGNLHNTCMSFETFKLSIYVSNVDVGALDNRYGIIYPVKS